MNLQDLRAKVKNITDYSPELASYQNQMDDLINDAYYSIWTAKRWKFAQIKDYVKIYPDLIAGMVSATAAVQNGSREVTFSAPVRMLVAENTMGPFGSQAFSTAYGSRGSAYEGEIFQSQGREYNIIKVVSPTVIHLDEQFRGTSDPADQTWVVKKRYYDLPDDCLELLNLSNRDVPAANGTRPPHGKLTGLSKRRDEEVNLREDYTATYAECYIDTPPVNVPPAEKFTLVSIVPDEDATLVPGTFIEICWAFHYWGGKIGPLSEPLTVQVTGIEGSGSVVSLQFSSFDDKPIEAAPLNTLVDRVPNKYEGLRKVVFFNQNINPATGKRLGLPCWRYITFGASAGSEGQTADSPKPLLVDDETSLLLLRYSNSFNAGNPRYVEWDGSTPRIRPYPRINAWDFYNPYVAQGEEQPGADEEYFRRLEMRYFKKPLKMVLATDTPQMPYEFHQLVVYAVLEDVYNKSGNLELADRYRRKIDKAIQGLERRYLDSVDTSFTRGSFTVGTDGFPIYDPTSLKLTP